MSIDTLAQLADACRDPDGVARSLTASGRTVVRTLGPCVARGLLMTAGLAPVRLGGGDQVPRSIQLPGLPELNPRVRAWLSAIVAGETQPLLIATEHPDRAALFAAVRELMRCGDLVRRPVFGLDQVPARDAAALRYNEARLRSLDEWVIEAGGRRVTDVSWSTIRSVIVDQVGLLRRLDGLRQGDPPRLSGTQMLDAMHSAAILQPDEHLRAILRVLDRADELAALPGGRVFVTGSPHESGRHYRTIESCGHVVVGEDHDPAPLEPAEGEAREDLWAWWARQSAPVAAMGSRQRARATVARARAVGARTIVQFCLADDQSEPWVLRWLRDEAAQAGLRLLAVSAPGDGGDDLTQALIDGLRPASPRRSVEVVEAVSRPRAGPAASSAAPHAQTPTSRPTAGTDQSPDTRSRKSLSALVADFGRYQREWFAGIRDRAAAGEPFAVVNADAPQEIFRAFDIPFVVNQWWGSIVAAKQQSRRYLELLAARGYPTGVEPYSSQGLAACFDADSGAAPWGGLPAPNWLSAFTSSAATRGIFSSWADETGAELLLFDRTVDTRLALPSNWWDRLPHDWDRVLEAPRLDLIRAQFSQAIGRIEQVTGRRFDEGRFRDVMDLVNEQEAYCRRARGLIARTRPAPVGIVDTMPATMVPQWHRGTVWGRDAARALYEAVEARVAQGQAACEGERLRLMWVGRGLWSDMAFYQRWERSHGAVFVWSMYLALAADGYLRYVAPGQDPLRALAARFVTMGDELRMPTWAGAWYVHEAQCHGVDAAIAIDDADPFVLRALERSGVPVLRLDLDNFRGGADGLAGAQAQVARFLDGLSPTEPS